MELPEHAAGAPSEAEAAIGKLIAENLVGLFSLSFLRMSCVLSLHSTHPPTHSNKVVDGATLQMGIGSIPNAVLNGLTNHKDLGIHTEMFSDGILPLVEDGVITNSKKKENQGRIVTAFCSGTRKLYDFIDDNPLVRFLDVAYVNNTHVISQQPKVRPTHPPTHVLQNRAPFPLFIHPPTHPRSPPSTPVWRSTSRARSSLIRLAR